MTQANVDSGFPILFSHSTCQEWGVGILCGESDGKRRYLFENGEERVMAGAFADRMRRVEQPDQRQRAAYARLRASLASRASADGVKTAGPDFDEQLEKFHQIYPAGLLDPKWIAEIRGGGDGADPVRGRDAIVGRAQELLARDALDSLISGHRYSEVCERVIQVWRGSDLVPSAQIRKPVSPDHERALATAVRELLHGSGPYEQRFNRYLLTLTDALGQPARWENATALSALIQPTQHVCVEPTAFRQQLKAFSRSSAGARPSGVAYTRFLSVSRLIANRLAERGELPRDLLDVRDFICTALKPASKVRTVRAKAKTKAPAVDSEE